MVNTEAGPVLLEGLVHQDIVNVGAKSENIDCLLFLAKERGGYSNLQVETLPGLPTLAQLSFSPLAPRRLINFHENNQMILSKPCSSPLSLGLPRSSLIVLRQFCPTAVGCSLHGSGHWSPQATTGVFQWFDSWWVNWSFGKCSKEESEEE